MQGIKTTHVGSLPRSPKVADMIMRLEDGAEVDGFAEAVTEHVAEIVARQRECGIDLVSDGETSKVSYVTYVKERLTGFAGDSPRQAPADLNAYPAYKKQLAQSGGTPTYKRPQCVGPVAMADMEPAHRDIVNLKAAIAKHGGEPFMNSVSPGTVAMFQPNTYYPDDDAYMEAVAEAMREEYEAINAAGLLLQIDCPDLGLGRHMVHSELTDEQFVTVAMRNVEVLNHALRNIAAERCRAHVCWGNYEGPHTCDIELNVMFSVVMALKPQALLVESSNPRHEHEWQVFADNAGSIPSDKVLVPGVIDSTTNFVEHPQLVAQRLERFINIVGAERIIAGTDCGFATFAGFGAVHPDITWAKLRSLCAGAELAAS